LRLIINGQEREIQSSVNITELLLELEIKGSHLAVALNSQVIPRDNYESTPISENDKIEIVTAVGGGV
jgi:thiamine biosynthesis protein ThiS